MGKKKAKYVIKISFWNGILKYSFKYLDDICNTSSLEFTRTIKKKKRGLSVTIWTVNISLINPVLSSCSAASKCCFDYQRNAWNAFNPEYSGNYFFNSLVCFLIWTTKFTRNSQKKSVFFRECYMMSVREKQLRERRNLIVFHFNREKLPKESNRSTEYIEHG